MFVIKRNGEKVPFDKQKIVSAINGALIEVDTFLKDDELAITIAETIHRELYGNNLEEIEVENIQELLEQLDESAFEYMPNVDLTRLDEIVDEIEAILALYEEDANLSALI